MAVDRRVSQKPKILIVEDETITAHHLQRILTRLGYEVVGVAASGAMALEQIAESKPDLLLADVGLEGDIDGIAVASMARERWETPTVFLTAYSDPETMRRARVTEPYGYLVKPFAEQELHATIEIALQQCGLEAARKQRVQSTNHLLVRTQEELNAVTARLFTAQEEERERIARDLHDDLGHRLALLQMDVEKIRGRLPEPIREEHKMEFEEALGRIGGLADSLRDVSHLLHPSILDDLGLEVALRRLCEEFQARYSIATRFSARSVPAHILASTAVALYRIVQEALQNVAKHAGPASVNVALIGAPDSLKLSVRDTGGGFDQASEKSRAGLGLISMAQRAKLAGGTFEIESKPNTGTQIHVSVPLDASKSISKTRI
jgi:signal transduction histidine kinase